MTIREKFDAFVSSNTLSDREELTKDIREYNTKALINSCVEYHIIDREKLFSIYSEQEKVIYTGYSLERDDNNYTLTTNKAFDILPYDLLSNSVVKAAFDKESKKASKALKLVNAFLSDITGTEDSEETTVSVKALKSELDNLFTNYGFTGHVTSKAIRVYIIDKATAKKTECKLKSINYKSLLDILYRIHCDNKRALKTTEENK